MSDAQKNKVCRTILKIVEERNLPQQLGIAMCANAGAESAYKPNARQVPYDTSGNPLPDPHRSLSDSEYLDKKGTGIAYGLFQIDGSKKQFYNRWAKKRGLDYGIESQINFVLDDITNNLDENSGSHFGYGNGKTLLRRMSATYDNDAATMLFARSYEKPRDLRDGVPTEVFNNERKRRLQFVPVGNELYNLTGRTQQADPMDLSSGTRTTEAVNRYGKPVKVTFLEPEDEPNPFVEAVSGFFSAINPFKGEDQ